MPVALNTETNILCALNAQVRISIYIYIYILDSHMAPYGACEAVKKHRSKQCSVSESEMSKSELSTVDSNAWIEAAQCLRRKDKQARAVISSALAEFERVFRAAQRSRSWLERPFRAP